MSYDLAIIGSGPGGYVAAIRAAQLGLKTVIIEKSKTLGGTCLNVGCIPSKAMLDSSEHFYNAKKHFRDHGIGVSKLSLDLAQMVKRKADVVSQTCSGIDYLMNKNKIEVVHGFASFLRRGVLHVKTENSKIVEIKASKFIIATGSKASTPKVMGYDGNRVISSTEALEITKLPKKMIVIGAGVIGLELGSVFARLGTEVSIIEFQDRIISMMDSDCSKELRRSLKKIGIKFYLGHAVQSVVGQKSQAKVMVQKKGEKEAFEMVADYCLVAIGRVPYTSNLGLENIGVKLDSRGRVEVDEYLMTNVDGVYAIGDVIKGAMLAHKAEEEGVFVAEYLAGQKPHIDYNLIPGVVYTWPEVSAVGKTEEELKEIGVSYKVGKFPYKALGRARASGDTEGMIKVLSDEKTDEILGVHMVGARAADMIMEAVALMEFRATAEDMSRISHPHPSYTEAVREAALAATDNRPLHI